MKRLVSIVVVVMAVIIGGCAPAAAPSPVAGGQTGGASAGQSRVVHFYNFGRFTGPSAHLTVAAPNAIELGAKRINDAGGFTDSQGNRYTIKLTKFDVSDSREQTVAGLRQAADDPTVLAVIGPGPSVNFLAALPVAEQTKMPLLSYTNGVAVKAWNPYSFRNSVVEPRVRPTLLKTFGQLGLKRIAALYDSTNDIFSAAATGLKADAPSAGLEVVASEGYRLGDVDFHAQLTKIKATKPDALGALGTSDEVTKIVQQAEEVGLLGQVKLFAEIGSFVDPKVWELTGGKIKDAVDWVPYFNVESKDPEVVKFVADYKSMFSEDPSWYTPLAYQVLLASVDAVKRSGTSTDREKFRDAIADTNISALEGKLTWKSPRSAPDGENQTPSVAIVRITGPGTSEPLK